jgi:hypothetical protein
MLSCANRLPLLALAGLVALVGPGPAARAQSTSSGFRVVPTPTYQSPYNMGGAWGVGYSPGQAFQTVPVLSPYAPWGYYNVYPDPYGGGLSGAADAINAQGQFEVQFQQSRLLNQEVERSKIDTRHKQWEEWLYERNVRPTVEDERERQRIENLRRARNNPPFAEIWSGQALNDLLLAVQQQQAKTGPGPSVPLDPEVLQHINVTSGTTPGGAGLLKDGGRLQWPLVLRKPFFEADRKRLEELMAQAVGQARSGQVDADTLEEMQKHIGSLRAEVRAHLDDITPSDDVRAKRYLNELDNAVRALQDPDVAKYLSGKWAARGNTVGDLVAEMARQGLKFAPAVAGDEAAYNALHHALVTYYAGPESSRTWDALAK